MKTILLLFGGESPEHEVSIMSAKNIVDALSPQKYHVVLGYIDTDGRLWQVNEVKLHDNTDDFEEIVPVLGDKKIIVGSAETHIDVLFPVLHGRNGEDGSVQALAGLMHVQLVGCGIAASSICIDKVLTKQLVASRDVPVVSYITRARLDETLDYAQVVEQLGSPVFVKPARLGSSIGVSKVSNSDEFTSALSMALDLDDTVLIEQAIDGRELEVAVHGNEDPEVTVVGEIVPDRDFYNYESKYEDTSESLAVIPAKINNEVSEQIRAYALQVYKTLGCSGLARVDFFYDEATGKIYLNEVNTLPGFTNISMYPKLCQASGMSYEALVDKLIELAR
ncbi:MAG: D-alanine--D-alanine ligase family protein [Candidatus Saccharimonadales bacterium]